MRGFEPLTTWSQTRYATRLRHTPKVSNYTVIGLLVNAYFEPYLIYFICTIYLLFKVVIVKVSFLFICIDNFDIVFIGNIIFYNWTINKTILSFNLLYVCHDNLLFRLHVSYTRGKLSNWKSLESLIGSGARNGARTRDNRNHNPGLYQLSYSRHNI